MIFLNYDVNANRNNQDATLSRLAEDSLRKNDFHVVPTRPIPTQALRNYLKFDRIEKETPKKIHLDKKKSSYCKLIEFILINYGILFLTLIYVIVGALVFQVIEQPHEISKCQMGEGAYKRLLYDTRVELINYIYYNTTTNQYVSQNDPYQIPSLNTVKDTPNIYQPKLTLMLKKFRNNILSIYTDYGYHGQNCIDDSKWNLLSAILFTMSIVSTLGYGVATPITWQGQLLCISYALYGIPLLLISVTKISKFLSDMFRFIYFHFICFPRRRSEKLLLKAKKEKLEKENIYKGFLGDLVEKQQEIIDENKEKKEKTRVIIPLVLVFVSFLSYTIIGGYLFVFLESEAKWSVINGIYFVFISVATIGFGDYVSGWSDLMAGHSSIAARNFIISPIYIIIGISILGMVFNLIQDSIKTKIDKITAKFLDNNNKLKEKINKEENHLTKDGKETSFGEEIFNIDSVNDEITNLKKLEKKEEKKENFILKNTQLFNIEVKKRMMAEKLKQKMTKKIKDKDSINTNIQY